MNLLYLFGIKSHLLLILERKYIFSYQRLFIQGIRDLKAEKSADKYIFCVFYAFMRLSITNFLYAIG